MSSEVIVAFITGVLGPILIILAKKFTDKKQTEDPVAETLKETELVLKKLEEIKDGYKADRVWICQFHNGGNFYPTGKSLTKLSMIYEVVGINAISIQSQFQNIPVGLFSRTLNHLLEFSKIEIPDYKDQTIATYGLKYVAEDVGCKSTYMFAIQTIDNKFIAAMGLDFTKKKTVLTEHDISIIKTEVAILGGVLVGKKNSKRPN